MIHGLDASSVQGALPFGALKAAGYRFVIIKAQQGNDGLDPNFTANVRGAFAIGMEPFAYCFAYPLPHLDPKEQARLFVEKTKGLLLGRPIFVDFEWPAPQHWAQWKCTAKQMCTWVRALCEEITELTGIQPVLYLYPFFEKALLDGGGDMSWASKYALWLAAYVKTRPTDGDAPDCQFTFGRGTRLPPPWKTWLFWQWDGDGGMRLPNGVDADFVVFNGDESALHAFARNSPKDEPSTAPTPEVHAIDLKTTLGLQTRLLALGFNPGPLDGVLGPKTSQAVRAFQKSHGLVVDGVVGPKTREALART